MIKLCSYNSIDNSGKHFFHIDDTSINMRKVAGVTLPIDLQNFLKTYTPSSSDVDTYITNAMSAFETYGPNLNGDAFLEPMLKDCHNTFVTNSKFFKYHVNKPDSPSYGKVVYSTYDEDMHRVLLVIEVHGNKLPIIKERYNSGEPVFVSMGCAVPYDTCSICGNRARTPKEYCDHLTHERLKIRNDGKMAYMINPHGKFFDISYVIIPADQTAFFITKHNAVDGANEIGLSEIIKDNKEPYEDCLKVASLIEEDDLHDETINASDAKVSVDDKIATMIKQVTSIIKEKVGNTNSELFNEIKRLRNSEKDFDNETIEILSKFPLGKVLSSLLACGIIVKPREFQRLVLLNKGEKEIDKKLEMKGLVISPEDIINHPEGNVRGIPLSDKDIDIKIIAKVSNFMDEKSFLQPFYSNRNTLLKHSKLINTSQGVVESNDPFFLAVANNRTPIDSNDVIITDQNTQDPSLLERASSNAVPVLSGLGAMYAGYLLNTPEFIEKNTDKIIKTLENKELVNAGVSNLGKAISLLGGAYALANSLNILSPPLTERQKLNQEVFKISSFRENFFTKSLPYVTTGIGALELSRNYELNDMEKYINSGKSPKRGIITSTIKNHPLATSMLLPISLMKMPIVGKFIKKNPIIAPALGVGGLLLMD